VEPAELIVPGADFVSAAIVHGRDKNCKSAFLPNCNLSKSRLIAAFYRFYRFCRLFFIDLHRLIFIITGFRHILLRWLLGLVLIISRLRDVFFVWSLGIFRFLPQLFFLLGQDIRFLLIAGDFCGFWPLFCLGQLGKDRGMGELFDRIEKDCCGKYDKGCT
jgi:hypothetical protein